jgi:hypothetical protein
MIQNYDEIIIQPNTLVVMDLDETIIQFKGMYETWWEDYKRNNSDIFVYREWVKHISSTLPDLLDSVEFSRLMNRIKKTNSRMIVLTARNLKLCELTLQQLTYCNIHLPLDDIYFSDKKGKTLHSLKRKYSYSNIVFVDDKKKNIDDVALWNPEVNCYHIRHKNINVYS